jgi:hypothetical protein
MQFINTNAIWGFSQTNTEKASFVKQADGLW